MASSKDVAKLAGVSVSSVSRAFREDCYISPDVKSKVLRAAEQLGYTPNLIARGLKNQKSNIIGLIISDIENPFYSSMTRIIEAQLKKSGYRLLLSYSNENFEQETDDLYLLAGSRVDGIIFIPTSNKNRGLINSLRKQNIALMQMYRTAYTDIDTVLVDDKKGAYMATKHLIQNGHKDILLLSVESAISPNRASGYREALEEENIPVREEFIMHLPFQTDLRNTIHSKLEQLRPTAVITGTNTIGMDVIKVCKEHKISIPNDMSLVMFDDVSWASLLDITTIAQPIENIGLSAARTIMDRIDKQYKGDPIVSVLEPHLISRNSVKNLYAK